MKNTTLSRALFAVVALGASTSAFGMCKMVTNKLSKFSRQARPRVRNFFYAPKSPYGAELKHIAGRCDEFDPKDAQSEDFYIYGDSYPEGLISRARRLRDTANALNKLALGGLALEKLEIGTGDMLRQVQKELKKEFFAPEIKQIALKRFDLEHQALCLHFCHLDKLFGKEELGRIPWLAAKCALEEIIVLTFKWETLQMNIEKEFNIKAPTLKKSASEL